MTLPTARCAAAAVPVMVVLFGSACQEDDLRRSEFVIECTNECAVNVEREICVPYCECAFEYVQDRPGLRGRIERGEIPFASTTLPEAVGMVGACGSDLYDYAFRSTCERHCAPETPAGECEKRCECMLRELRGSAPRAVSTAWLLENLRGQPNAAGRERLEAARHACLQHPDD